MNPFPTRAILWAACALFPAVGHGANAEVRPEHFEGKAATTLEAALANLAESNALIAELVADGGMSPAEHAELHRLTYTAENALAKLSEELESLQASLEAIHLASERIDSETVLEQTPAYLDQSRRLFGGDCVSGDFADRR